MDDAAAMALVRGLDRELTRGVATSVTDLGWGELVLTEDLPEVHDQNLVVVHAGADVDAATVLRVADERLAAAGAEHRRVAYEDGAAFEAAVDTFTSAGWEASRFVVMAHDPPADAPRPRRPDWPTRAVELTDEQFDDLTERLTLDRPWCDGDLRMARVFVRYGFRCLDALDTTVVGVLGRDGRAIGAARVYAHGTVRQIEEVEVVEDLQGKGTGRVLLDAALHVAWADEPDLVFLVADADDWPWRWYARRGFRTIGRTGAVHRPPPG